MVGLANRQMYPGLSGEMASWNTWVSFISASMFEKEKVLEVRFAKQNCEKVFGGGILAVAEQYGDRRAVRVHASSRLCAWRPHRTTRACHTNTYTPISTPRRAAPHEYSKSRGEDDRKKYPFLVDSPFPPPSISSLIKGATLRGQNNRD